MSYDTRTEVMGRDPIGSLLFRFSMPAIIGLLANALYNIVDRMFIGRIVGSRGLAAVTVAFPYFGLAITAGILITVGSSSIVSRCLGRGDRGAAEEVLANAFMMALAGGISLLLAGFCCGEPMLRLFGASDQVIGPATDYLRIVALGMPFLVMTFSMNGLMRAEGAPRWAMGTMLIGTLTNIFLDWLFIVVLGWGVKGAAWGTTLAQAAALGWVILFYRRHSSLKIRKDLIRPRRKIILPALAIGISPGLLEVSFVTLLVIINRIMGRLGGDLAISAVGIFFSLDSLFYLPALGIGEGVQPLVGFNYGAGKIKRVKGVVKLAILAAAGIFTLFWMTVQAFPVLLVNLFSRGDIELGAIAARGLRLGYLLLPLMSLYIVTSYTFQALGKARATFVLQVLRQIVFCFPMLLILPHFVGTDGVWLAFPLMDLSGFILALTMLRSEMRQWETLEEAEKTSR
ncbi:MAG TPA: MATE family efflux transporter [Synergistales bacterium]|nr:MATE family efflux transporter [Synergistales bacterium]HPC75316.1 MATE family efflux transporter [Synergistales bacterium]HRS48247.1 MATE family efflux transporter [Thermovirgaceae bacterium]HRU90559.1 MATE family efflux transporter [Thermovirgaceae bacterium]